MRGTWAQQGDVGGIQVEAQVKLHLRLHPRCLPTPGKSPGARRRGNASEVSIKGSRHLKIIGNTSFPPPPTPPRHTHWARNGGQCVCKMSPLSEFCAWKGLTPPQPSLLPPTPEMVDQPGCPLSLPSGVALWVGTGDWAPGRQTSSSALGSFREADPLRTPPKVSAEGNMGQWKQLPGGGCSAAEP